MLLGTTTTFTGCVDNTESASVEAIRGAKADQLKAAAELDRANAEAALITANAEKAYMEAQAEYQKALAAAQNADNAEKTFLLQQAKDEYQRNLEAVDLSNFRQCFFVHRRI